MPKATVERGAGRARFTNRQKIETHVIVPVVDNLAHGRHPEQGSVMRIRLRKVVEPKGSFRSDARGVALAGDVVVVTETFLDGSTRTTTIIDGLTQNIERTPVAISPVPVRTKDIVDFGRLESAVQALVAEAQRYTADNPPSDAQMESLLASYQGILGWREKAAAALAAAEGKIDIAGTLMRKVVSL